MESTIEKVGDVVVVTPQYESLDAKSVNDFRNELDVLDNRSRVVLDLNCVGFIDSAGLGAIVTSLKRIRSANGDIKICGVHKPVLALFELVRMHKLVDIYADREETLKAYGC